MVSNAELIARRSLRAARARVARYVRGNMLSEVRVLRGDAAVLGADGELDVDPDPTVVYQGRARLGTAQGPISYTVGEEVQFYSSGTVTIPADWVPDETQPFDVEPTMPAVNDLLEVTAHDDHGFVGRRFRVIDVESAGLLSTERRLQIVGVQRYAGWVDSAVRHPSAGWVPDEVPPEWRV